MNENLSRLWGLTIIAPWYLYKYQRPVYDFFEKTRDPFFEATRRFGKTATKLVQIQERSRRQEQRATIWAEPWREQARKIVIPEMAKIQETCPGRLKARFYRTDSFFEFPTTGSRIFLIGVNEDLAEGMRGQFAHEIVCDELGSYREADYIINEVFRPMLLTTKGELCELGTPPDDLGHIFYRRKQLAMVQGRYIGKDFDCIDTISPEKKASFIDSMGGRNSPAVRRELYLEPVSDPEKLVIPEFNQDAHVFKTRKKPEAFTPYVGIDLGFNDFTAILFAYYDFEKATLVVQDEIVVNGKNSEEIVTRAKAKEKELWGPIPVNQRWSDNDQQQLYDMLSLYKYPVIATRKDDKQAAINHLRLRFTNGTIAISEKCVNLILQLKTGIWAENKKAFVRNQSLGHLDAIDALIYLNRNVNEKLNPFNPLAGAHYSTHYIPQDLLNEDGMSKVAPSSDEIEIGRMFGG